MLCAGGHATVLVDALGGAGRHVVCCLDDDAALHGQSILGVPVDGEIGLAMGYAPDKVLLVNGMGSVARPQQRRLMFDRFRERGYRFATVVHPSAVVAESVALGEGAQVLAGAVVNPRARLCDDAVVNTRASVDHDCVVGPHSHVAPGATLSGAVRLGECTHVGAGAVVIQGVTIGRECTVGAGAVVLADVPDGATVVGVPARPVG